MLVSVSPRRDIISDLYIIEGFHKPEDEPQQFKVVASAYW